MSDFQRYNSISSRDLILSQGKFQQKGGTLKYGTSIDQNFGGDFNKAVFSVGSAYTQGNQVRSVFDMNDNGEFLYNYTPDDSKFIKNEFRKIFLKYPTLSEYPYLYPISQNWNAEGVSSISKEYPIYRYNGKGVGKINFRNNGNPKKGNVSQGTPEDMIFYKGQANSWHTNVGIIEPKPEPRNINGPTYPYSGLLYSGNLVQLDFEKESNEQPFKNVRINKRGDNNS